MTTLDEYHDKAMEKSFFADLERRRGNEEEASQLFQQALELELKAIGEITEPIEPTFSVLHRSAGWLALDCKQPRLAEQLACKALAGNPPEKIADELRDLWQQANFRRHFEPRESKPGEGQDKRASTIKIDEEVRKHLERRAIQEELVSGIPNQVLRRILGLDQPS